ncbi:hypothetical protein NLJ89_g907 [Agrocybe chaxingu]|uniref:Uncharacterized protein n=1 Tax=Agrocybe chaxingu TaxID=84603 RepID=A0A9W8N0Z4_9AGAR|nr:hypothetical protein NLJ89_g907 [Agrocybe chaxingu]
MASPQTEPQPIAQTDSPVHPPPLPLASAFNANDTFDQTVESPSPLCPLRIYTRQQLLSLSNSPLVKLPPDMPELKTWFGTENETIIHKKDEPQTPSSARERRFRRDAEDGDAPSRPTFRSTLQPSQMGNFKHQSLRANDRERERDRERDGDKERERDMRDKEGQERLRHLSDKYDRDRLALPLSSTRNKDRDAAPHLNSNTRGQQSAPSQGITRRGETREAAKKKVGAEPPRSGREDRAENGRRDREDRERARSRARDPSRAKRELSPSRRERDRDEPRERLPREDNRRDKDDSRRDREPDVDDDPRRWRDDGKRDERIAARRDRARNSQDHTLDADRRWGPGDERDGRYKRTTGRERKSGNVGDENKEKEDRREKEKEPAWMDTYIPSESSPGILGGQAPSGELDGIQAWKKGMKEKETKEKEINWASSSKVIPGTSTSAPAAPERPEMDEIQLFKLLMKKEEEKKRADESAPALSSEGDQQGLRQRQRSAGDEPQKPLIAPTPLANGEPSHPQPLQPILPPIDLSAVSLDAPSPFSLAPKEAILQPSGRGLPQDSQDRTLPRLFANSSTPELQVNQGKQAVDFTTNNAAPPAGSRLLAMRLGLKPGTSGNPNPNLPTLNGGLQNITPEAFPKNEPLRPTSGFSPFDDQGRQPFAFEDQRDVAIPSNPGHLSHRPSLDHGFNTSVNVHAETNYNGVSGKGSRFAKFFDGKSRDAPNLNPRQEHGSFGNVAANPGEHRSMDELFAMLNSSAQLLGNNGNFGAQGPSLHSLQQQHLIQQQQHANTRLEALYDSRGDDRSFMPDGLVPGLRPIPPPPPRGRDFNDSLDDSMHFNIQRLTQQQPLRSLEPLYSGPTPQLLAQQSGRHGGGLPLQSLQQPPYRGGPSPGMNQANSIPSGLQQQQRLPPGLANLGGRPPHEPSQFISLPGLPSIGPQHNLHNNGPLPQQVPFNNFNVGVGNSVGFNSPQARGPGPSLQNTGAQQLPLVNLGHPNLDPRLSNHHHLLGLGGSGVGGNRINGGFPQQGPNAPTHIAMRPQPQAQQPHLPPHMVPQSHLLPPHLQQQGHLAPNTPTNQDLIALLMGGVHRE